jgi:hypothetical protein
MAIPHYPYLLLKMPGPFLWYSYYMVKVYVYTQL